MKFEDDYVSAFWLSNCYELLCVVKSTQEKEAREAGRRRIQGGRRGSDTTETERALEKVRTDLDYLLIEIYHGWIKELKKRLANMIVPAVIENQSLPGYICKQSGGLWGKWGKSSASSQFTIEQLLNFLSKLSKTMRCYYMEDSMTRQILTELLRVIGVSAFNHLLMRKNFCTWKRGLYDPCSFTPKQPLTIMHFRCANSVQRFSTRGMVHQSRNSGSDASPSAITASR